MPQNVASDDSDEIEKEIQRLESLGTDEAESDEEQPNYLPVNGGTQLDTDDTIEMDIDKEVPQPARRLDLI